MVAERTPTGDDPSMAVLSNYYFTHCFCINISEEGKGIDRNEDFCERRKTKIAALSHGRRLPLLYPVEISHHLPSIPSLLVCKCVSVYACVHGWPIYASTLFFVCSRSNSAVVSYRVPIRGFNTLHYVICVL